MQVELEELTKFAPAYFDHVTAAVQQKVPVLTATGRADRLKTLRSQRPSTLAKIYGIFQISFTNKTTGKKGKLQVQITENLLAEKQALRASWLERTRSLLLIIRCAQVFDLKGLTRNRMTMPTGKPNEVLLDGNYLESEQRDAHNRLALC